MQGSTNVSITLDATAAAMLAEKSKIAELSWGDCIVEALREYQPDKKTKAPANTEDEGNQS